MKRICPKCGKEITPNNYERHIKACDGKVHEHQHLDHEGLNCKYCGKLCKNKNSLIQHEIRCKENSSGLVVKSNLGYYNQKGRKAWNKGLTKDTDTRVAQGGKTHHQRYLLGKYKYKHKKLSQEAREKLRNLKLKICAEQGTNLCGKGLRGYYKGFYCQSSWELAYVIYCLEHNIKLKRNKQRFKYILEGIERSYFPDFVLEDETYVEIKGYYDEKTKEKEKQFPKDKKLLILREKEMKPILEYVKNKYGKNYTYLYKENV